MARDGADVEQAMIPYDAEAWAEIERWREKQLRRKSGGLIPAGWRDRAKETGETVKEKFESLPGAERFEELFLKAIEGLTDLVSRTAMASVRDAAVIAAYQKRGHLVGSLEDIRKLDLRVIDDVRPKLDLAYSAASAAEGAAAGLAVSGGTLLATAGGVFGAGAGAAPGAGTVVGAMAADAAAVLVASNRVVAHTAAYYGYDVEAPDERLYALGVLGVGTGAQAGKAAAYIELNKLVQALARSASWKALDKNVVTRIVRIVYARLGMNLAKRKLGQAVPVVGIVLGAGLNARLIHKVADDANLLYRERFLRDRYGLATATLSVVHPGGEDGIRIMEIVDAEVADAEVVETEPAGGAPGGS